MIINDDAYQRAQRAIADLKSAVWSVLVNGPPEGLRNSDIGRALGIYFGHVEHQGHVSRSVLALMQADGTVKQDPETKRWQIRSHPET